jgi:predicted lipid-binding transport protein (Tim44 family)
MKKGCRKGLVFFAAFIYLFFGVLELDAFARAGGGRSSGSRGSRPSGPSRSYSAPSPSQPSTQPQPNSSQLGTGTPFQQPSSGGFLRGLAGGVMGGFLGAMLFRGLGFAGTGGGFGGGIGLFEILLGAALLFGVYWYFKSRRRVALARNESNAGTQYCYGSPTNDSYAAGPTRTPGTEGPVASSQRSDVDLGLQHIRQMDPTFDEAVFRETSSDIFFKIQAGWANRDLEPVKGLLTSEVFSTLKTDVDELRREKKVNRLDNIAVRSVDLVEVWQETGSDYLTVKFLANLLDYTVDEATGQVISGSKTDPVLDLRSSSWKSPLEAIRDPTALKLQALQLYYCNGINWFVSWMHSFLCQHGDDRQ